MNRLSLAPDMASLFVVLHEKARLPDALFFGGIPTDRKQFLHSSITLNIEKIFKASSEIEREIELAKEKNSSSKLPSTAF